MRFEEESGPTANVYELKGEKIYLDDRFSILPLQGVMQSLGNTPVHYPMFIIDNCDAEGNFSFDNGGRCCVENVVYLSGSPIHVSNFHSLTWQEFNDMKRPGKLELLTVKIYKPKELYMG